MENNSFVPINLSDSLTPGTSGGRKAMWLRQHRGQVIKYYQVNGEIATREKFNLQPATLHRLLNGKDDGNHHGRE